MTRHCGHLWTLVGSQRSSAILAGSVELAKNSLAVANSHHSQRTNQRATFCPLPVPTSSGHNTLTTRAARARMLCMPKATPSSRIFVQCCACLWPSRLSHIERVYIAPLTTTAHETVCNRLHNLILLYIRNCRCNSQRQMAATRACCRPVARSLGRLVLATAE